MPPSVRPGGPASGRLHPAPGRPRTSVGQRGTGLGWHGLGLGRHGPAWADCGSRRDDRDTTQRLGITVRAGCGFRSGPMA